VLETEFALCLGNSSPPVLHHNPAEGCPLLSTFSVRGPLILVHLRDTCIMSTNRGGQRIMPSYLLIRIENVAQQGKVVLLILSKWFQACGVNPGGDRRQPTAASVAISQHLTSANFPSHWC
jgi:hypothetical protein